jgi:(p)ppGpp synthase/HD superfamily hydrolase
MEESMETRFEQYDAALIVAARAHRTQVRKGSDIPYLVHPVHVSVLLIRHGFPEDVAIAGLLHDVVEDQNVPLQRIETDFGPAVAEMVDSLTERKLEDGKKRPWKVRKSEALAKLRTASDRAVAVKAADVLHNARSLANMLRREGPSSWAHYTGGPRQSVAYYRSVAGIARERLGPHSLVVAVEAAIADLESMIAEPGTA